MRFNNVECSKITKQGHNNSRNSLFFQSVTEIDTMNKDQAITKTFNNIHKPDKKVPNWFVS